jgi:hypothetical protein
LAAEEALVELYNGINTGKFVFTRLLIQKGCERIRVTEE